MNKWMMVIGCCLLLAVRMAQAGVPDGQALQVQFLADGGWLALEKKGLSLYDASGRLRAGHKVRAKQFDVRSMPGAPAWVAVLDADTQHARILSLDLEQGSFGPPQVLPQQDFGLESLCLYQDRQAYIQLFVLGRDGQAQQWLLGAEKSQPKLVRKLALALNPGPCRVNDAHQRLLVEEENVGLWDVQAESESAPQRRLLPLNKLGGGLSALAMAGKEMLLLDKQGQHLQRMQYGSAGWRQAAQQKLPRAASALALRRTQNGSEILLKTGGHGQTPAAWQSWQRLPVRKHPAAPWPEAVVYARAQSELMPAFGDAADDPAIWVHPQESSRVRVLGTNKKQGLMVYDLQGRQLQMLEVGRLNNVDLRQRVQFGTEYFDLALASQRDDNSLVLFAINDAGVVQEQARFATDLDKIYGLCLFRPRAGGLQVLVNDKDGSYRQYGLEYQAGKFSSRLLRQFKLASQPEGCVADDENELLFVGEEKRGLWRMSARPDAPTKMEMVLAVGPALVADVEGIALYQGRQRYLIVSSQGDSSYLVLDAAPPHKLRGKFRIGFNLEQGIDGSAETDGLEVVAQNLGTPYTRGMLVVQDGYKHLPGGAQNFKYVAWDDVARALRLD